MTPCYAQSPRDFSRQDWWQIVKRWVRQVNADNVSVAAAGVAFFSLLAIFPLLSAGLSLYGYIADPQDVTALIDEFAGFIPAESRQIIDDQISAVVSAPRERLGFGFLISVTLALYSAGAGIRAMMRALNIAYGEVERRSIVRFYLTALAFTLMTGLFFVVAVIAIIVIPVVLEFIYLGAVADQLARILPLVAVISVFGWASFMLYRFGPDRRPAKKRWTWPGAVFATLLWMAISVGFSVFVSRFADYNATYGSIASVIGLLMWFFLTAFVVLMGAELNAEMERQTLLDTTRGPKRPLGRRGANMADFLPLGLSGDDVEVEVVEPVVRPRHLRGTDVPEEAVLEDVTATEVPDVPDELAKS